MTKMPALQLTIRAWLLEVRSGVRRATQDRRLCDQPEDVVIMKRRIEADVPRRARVAADPGARHLGTSHNWGLLIMAVMESSP